ncbi:MAG: phosphotransferase [Paracoccaceae bacterium]
MDASPGGDTGRFVEVADWFGAQASSVPRLLAADVPRGLLLLEDLGDALIARLVAAAPEREAALYREITEFLLTLHDRSAPGFLALLGWPQTGAVGDNHGRVVSLRPCRGCGRSAGFDRRLYARHSREAPVMCLRDFHAETSFAARSAPGLRGWGFLDFQDAVAAHPAYDLVSALQDARRAVSPAVERAEIAHYATQKGLEQGRFSAVYALRGCSVPCAFWGFLRGCAKPWARRITLI